MKCSEAVVVGAPRLMVDFIFSSLAWGSIFKNPLTTVLLMRADARLLLDHICYLNFLLTIQERYKIMSVSFGCPCVCDFVTLRRSQEDSFPSNYRSKNQCSRLDIFNIK